jgi:hypothetical protein
MAGESNSPRAMCNDLQPGTSSPQPRNTPARAVAEERVPRAGAVECRY